MTLSFSHPPFIILLQQCCLSYCSSHLYTTRNSCFFFCIEADEFCFRSFLMSVLTCSVGVAVLPAKWTNLLTWTPSCHTPGLAPRNWGTGAVFIRGMDTKNARFWRSPLWIFMNRVIWFIIFWWLVIHKDAKFRRRPLWILNRLITQTVFFRRTIINKRCFATFWNGGCRGGRFWDGCLWHEL